MRGLHFTIYFLLITATFGYSQSIKELEKNRNKTEQEIEFTSKLLTETEKQRVQSLNQLNTLKKQVELRKKLISDFEKQIQLVEKDIDEKNLIIAGLQKDLNNLKKEYAKLIRFAWRNRVNMQIIIFIFASNDFNQAYRRIRFYQQLLKFRDKQAKEITNIKQLIQGEIESLTKQRENLTQLKIEKGNEILNLGQEETRYAVNIKQLKNKEKQLRKEIEERKRAMEVLDKAIADLIAEEAKRAAERDKVRDSRYLRLSDGFAGNKGKLPWPTSPGVIIGEFGEHNHPVLKDIKIRNNGIDISTGPNSQVRAIFEGEVKKVVNIPGSNVSVIIRHGDYLSVYSNLIKISVKVGDTVTAAQIIGEAFTEPGSGQGILNLQIWQENKIQNPMHWILP
jgi:septal ring factor EnvC (AmiA/AmiB activator)